MTVSPTAAHATLRGMRWWDIEPVLVLERAAFPDDPWRAETFWAELARPETRSYVVAVDAVGLVVGYGGLMGAGSEADITTLAVDAGWRGRGVGTALLRRLVGIAARRGAGQVMLEVRADNPVAQRLYRAHGFTRIAVRRAYYQPGGVDAHVMRLRPIPGEASGWAPVGWVRGSPEVHGTAATCPE